MYTSAGLQNRQNWIEEYAPLVKRIAHHLMAKLPASVEVDDIIQAGMMGLMDAAGRFEVSQGTHFEVYAAQRIRGAMLDELRANDWMPRSVRRNQRRIEQAMARLEQKHGRAPSDTEMAAELGLSLDDYQSLLGEARGAQLVYYSGFDDDSESEFLDRHIADAAPTPPDVLADARFREALVAGIEKLSEREKMVMGLYYEQDLNFREITATLGVTESRVCQIHSQAIAHLRVRLKDW